jgi:hypothetical protein
MPIRQFPKRVLRHTSFHRAKLDATPMQLLNICTSIRSAKELKSSAQGRFAIGLQTSSASFFQGAMATRRSPTRCGEPLPDMYLCIAFGRPKNQPGVSVKSEYFSRDRRQMQCSIDSRHSVATIPDASIVKLLYKKRADARRSMRPGFHGRKQPF